MEDCKSGPGVNPAAIKRLKRAEGQVKGILRMVEENKYCIDILTQIAAARGALHKAGMVILKSHIEHCVSDAIKSGEKESQDLIEELMVLLDREGV